MKRLFCILALSGLLGTDVLVGQESSGTVMVGAPVIAFPRIVGDDYLGTVWQGERLDQADVESYFFDTGSIQIDEPLILCSGEEEFPNVYLDDVLTLSCSFLGLTNSMERFYAAYSEQVQEMSLLDEANAEDLLIAIVWIYAVQQPASESTLVRRHQPEELQAFYIGHFAVSDEFPGTVNKEAILSILTLFEDFIETEENAREEASTVTWALMDAPEGLEMRVHNNSLSLSFRGWVSQPGAYRFKIQAMQGDIGRQRSITLDVLPTELALFYESDEYNIAVGETLQGIFYLSGNTAEDYNFSLSYEGQLPDGVELDFWDVEEYGQKFIFLRGNPESAGEFPITLVASNLRGTQRLDIKVTVAETIDSTDESPDETTIDENAPDTEEPVPTPEDNLELDPETEPKLTLSETALGPNLVEFTPGFAYSPWMGFVFVANEPWIYNFEMGWLYVHEETASDEEVWFYHAGNPSLGWMFGGSHLEQFFYYEVAPGNWGWQWFYTGAVDRSIPGDSPTNP